MDAGIYNQGQPQVTAGSWVCVSFSSNISHSLLLPCCSSTRIWLLLVASAASHQDSPQNQCTPMAQVFSISHYKTGPLPSRFLSFFPFLSIHTSKITSLSLPTTMEVLHIAVSAFLVSHATSDVGPFLPQLDCDLI